MSLEIRQIIQIGRAQLKELLPELSIDDVQPADIRLEEIEKDGGNWAITYSFPNPFYSPGASLLSGPNSPWSARLAKVVVVDGADGKLVALKERAAA